MRSPSWLKQLTAIDEIACPVTQPAGAAAAPGASEVSICGAERDHQIKTLLSSLSTNGPICLERKQRHEAPRAKQLDPAPDK